MEWLLLLPPFHRVPRDPFSLCAKKIDVAHRLLGGSDHEAEGRKVSCFLLNLRPILNNIVLTFDISSFSHQIAKQGLCSASEKVTKE